MSNDTDTDTETETETETELTIKTTVKKNGLYLRASIAEATVEDGRTVEIATNMGGGAILVTVYRKKGRWRTYVLTPAALVNAVLAKEDEATPKVNHG